MTGRVCAVEVCDRPARTRGMCEAHYRRSLQGWTLDTPIGKPGTTRTHCPQGHEYSDENTAMDRRSRRCRTCTLARQRARREAERANQTHCPQGHEYNAENTRRDQAGRRYCRECSKRRQSTRRANHPAPRKAKPPKSKLPKGWDKPADRDPKRDRERTVDKNTQWVDPGPPLGPELVAAAQALLARHDAQDLAAMLGLDKKEAA